MKSVAPNEAASIWFSLSLDMVTESRTVYGVFDLLGDVGGLFDMLKLVSEIFLYLITVVFGSNLDIFMIRRLFK